MHCNLTKHPLTELLFIVRKLARNNFWIQLAFFFENRNIPLREKPPHIFISKYDASDLFFWIRDWLMLSRRLLVQITIRHRTHLFQANVRDRAVFYSERSKKKKQFSSHCKYCTMKFSDMTSSVSGFTVRLLVCHDL